MLQLLSFVGVLEDQCVQVAVASDLELDLVGLARLLDAGGCERSMSAQILPIVSILPHLVANNAIHPQHTTQPRKV